MSSRVLSMMATISACSRCGTWNLASVWSRSCSGHQGTAAGASPAKRIVLMWTSELHRQNEAEAEARRQETWRPNGHIRELTNEVIGAVAARSALGYDLISPFRYAATTGVVNANGDRGLSYCDCRNCASHRGTPPGQRAFSY
jgi:hypothetical protein